jgi:hypothetical protein
MFEAMLTSDSDVSLYVIIRKFLGCIFNIQDDSKLLSGFPWPIIFKAEIIK